jgi:hypothetical protein
MYTIIRALDTLGQISEYIYKKKKKNKKKKKKKKQREGNYDIGLQYLQPCPPIQTRKKKETLCTSR